MPERYRFWDLHVANQGAMGWLDYHMHEFGIPGPGKRPLRIGIPDEEIADAVRPGRETGIAELLFPGLLGAHAQRGLPGEHTGQFLGRLLRGPPAARR